MFDFLTDGCGTLLFLSFVIDLLLLYFIFSAVCWVVTLLEGVVLGIVLGLLILILIKIVRFIFK